jgi:SagB-type dehydrogenase family enzyme
LSSADLHALLHEAHHAQRDARSETAPTALVELYVLADRVEDLPRGIYRYAPGHGLHPAGQLPPAAGLEDFVFQREFSRAPVLITAVAHLAQVLAAQGSHGYRTLLTRAGAALHAAWLAATSRNLVGCITAGVLTQALHDHADVDGYHKAALAALAIGHPIPPTTAPRTT